MQRALFALVIAAMPTVARADDVSTHLDIGARAAGSVAVGPQPDRAGLVPSVMIRVTHDVGPVRLGGTLGAGLPAYYGQHEASLCAEVERVLRAKPGTTRISLVAGADVGVSLLFFDAPPEVPAMSDALLYWGPLARVRAGVELTQTTLTGMRIGARIEGGVGTTLARYMSTADGTGTRLEPSLAVSLSVGL